MSSGQRSFSVLLQIQGAEQAAAQTKTFADSLKTAATGVTGLGGQVDRTVGSFSRYTTTLNASGRSVTTQLGPLNQFNTGLKTSASTADQATGAHVKLNAAMGAGIGFFGTAVGAVGNLAGSFQELERAEIQVDASHLKLQRANLALSRATEDVNKLQAQGKQGTLDYQQALDKQANAQEAVAVAEDRNQLAQSRLSETQLSFVENILPQTIQGVTSVIASFASMRGEMGNVKGVISNLLPSITNLTGGFTGAVGGAGVFTGALGNIGKTAPGAAIGIRGIGSAALAVAPEIAVIVAAIISLKNIMDLVPKVADNFTHLISGDFATIKANALDLVTSAADKLPLLGTFLEPLIPLMKQWGFTSAEAAKQVEENTKTATDAAAADIEKYKGVLESLGEVTKNTGADFVVDFNKAKTAFGDFTDQSLLFLNTFKETLSNTGLSAEDRLGALRDEVKAIGPAFQAIGGTVAAAWNQMNQDLNAGSAPTISRLQTFSFHLAQFKSGIEGIAATPNPFTKFPTAIEKAAESLRIENEQMLKNNDTTVGFNSIVDITGAKVNGLTGAFATYQESLQLSTQSVSNLVTAQQQLANAFTTSGGQFVDVRAKMAEMKAQEDENAKTASNLWTAFINGAGIADKSVAGFQRYLESLNVTIPETKKLLDELGKTYYDALNTAKEAQDKLNNVTGFSGVQLQAFRQGLVDGAAGFIGYNAAASKTVTELQGINKAGSDVSNKIVGMNNDIKGQQQFWNNLTPAYARKLQLDEQETASMLTLGKVMGNAQQQQLQYNAILNDARKSLIDYIINTNYAAQAQIALAGSELTAQKAQADANKAYADSVSSLSQLNAEMTNSGVIATRYATAINQGNIDYLNFIKNTQSASIATQAFNQRVIDSTNDGAKLPPILEHTIENLKLLDAAQHGSVESAKQLMEAEVKAFSAFGSAADKVTSDIAGKFDDLNKKVKNPLKDLPKYISKSLSPDEKEFEISQGKMKALLEQTLGQVGEILNNPAKTPFDAGVFLSKVEHSMKDPKLKQAFDSIIPDLESSTQVAQQRGLANLLKLVPGSEDIARTIANRLGIPIETLLPNSAQKGVDATQQNLQQLSTLPAWGALENVSAIVLTQVMPQQATIGAAAISASFATMTPAIAPAFGTIENLASVVFGQILPTSANTGFSSIQQSAQRYLGSDLQGIFAAVQHNAQRFLGSDMAGVAGGFKSAVASMQQSGQRYLAGDLDGIFAKVQKDAQRYLGTDMAGIAHAANSAFASISAGGRAMASSITSSAGQAQRAVQSLINTLNSVPKNVSSTVTTNFVETHRTVFLAKGFHGVVNSPVNFTAGEAGPELVSVTPLSRGSTTMSQTTNTVHNTETSTITNNNNSGGGGRNTDRPIIILLDGKPIATNQQNYIGNSIGTYY